MTEMINWTLKFFKPFSILAGVIASSACAAGNPTAVSNELIELALPFVDQERLPTSPSSPSDTQLRALIKDLKDLAANEVRAFGEEAYVHTEQAGNRGEKLLIYATNPKGAVGYIIPFSDNIDSENVLACRFEMRVERFEEPARIGTRATLLSLWPGIDCEKSAPNLTAIVDLKANLTDDGYAVFAESGVVDGARAAVIEHSNRENGDFDVEAAIDQFRANKRDIVRSFVMPIFHWKSGVAELENGKRIFYFDDEITALLPRSICIIDGITWHQFRHWERRETKHPLKSFCKTQLHKQRETQSDRDRERWKNLSPPRIQEKD